MLLSILTFDFDSILGSLLTFWGPNGLFLGLGMGSNTVLGSNHVVEQLSFSIFSSILIFDFSLTLGSLASFCGPNGLFLGLGFPNGLFIGLGLGSTTVLGSSHVIEQLSFSMFLSILTFDVDLILGSFFTFWGPNGLFLGL